MVDILGSRIDSLGTVIGTLAELTPRSDDILRILFPGMTATNNTTEPIDTAGYSLAVVTISDVAINPAAPESIICHYRTSKVGGANGILTENTLRGVQAVVAANGTWSPGYIEGLLSRFVHFQFTAAMTIDLLIELRKVRVNTGPASAG